MGQLDSKRVDTVANDVAVSDERKEKYLFTDTYSKSGTQLATAKDNDAINEIADFTNGTIAGVLGSNHIEKLKALIRMKRLKSARMKHEKVLKSTQALAVLKDM